MFEQLKKNSRSQVTKINPENSITCTNVPQSLLTKVTAKEYFTQFGNLLKITIRPKKHIITVIYATKKEANVAYNKSGDYLGEKFNIEWTKLCTSPKCPTKKKDPEKNIMSRIVSNFFKSSDDEIKSELDAMTNLEYNPHERTNFDGIPVKRYKTQQPKTTSKSMTRLEKASVKPEKLKSDSQISELLPNATIEELQNIIQQPAHTSEDKYKVLEARDRLIRIRQVKSHTLDAAKVMTGTCPDMCPEKERLMRESKRQVALYEQHESNEYRINHMIAVKQYSRSSADQEEPMAHELRPVKSLKMTMSYLLHEIANLCDQQGTNLGEWYHFLWDRTRGIRKDITQQELCCTDSVQLVEQCARFHIICSERLCAEEPSVFDKKINSDNLTKCLQSLKYMYHDLRVKGINCKNESEFRAYIILLNLNNGNFMWDLQRLPTCVQKSSEVRFAMEIYSALESNNYNKFFKFVKKTTYLNACILLRYFNQVRLKALSVLVKAYCRTASTAYPLCKLIDILGFEDENEAVYFCEQVGLNVLKDGLHVLLNRHNFTMPVLDIKQNRACNLIESKRTKQYLAIGECIAGGEMPEKTYKFHKPHNSFNSSGYLMPDSVNAEDQNKYAIFTSTDTYEFADKGTTKTDCSKSQSINTGNTFTTEYIINRSNPISTTEASINICTSIKSDADIPFVSKSQAQIDVSRKNMYTLSAKLKMEDQEDVKTFGSELKQQPNESPISSNIFNTKSVTYKAGSNTLSEPFLPLSSSNTSPFTAFTNKSIFSEISQGNVSMNNVAPSTIFSVTHSNLALEHVSKSPSIANSATTINKSTSKGTQDSISHTTEVKRQTPQEENVEKLKLEKEESFGKRLQQVNKAAEEILNSLQEEIMQSCCSTVVKEEMERIHICNTFSEDINNKILNDVTSEICDSTLKEELVTAKKLYEMSTKMKNRVIIRYFNTWKLNALKRKQQRKALECTPVWLQKYSSNECAKLLYSTKQGLVIKNMRTRHDEPKHVKPYSSCLAPIEFIIYTGIRENLKFVDISTQFNYFWKLIISYPNLHNKTVLWHHKKIMNEYLSPEDYTADPIIKLYQPNQIETLHVCIRHFEGLISDHNLIGSDALLFIADASEETKFIIKRLTKTVLLRDKLMAIPLVFIICGELNSEKQSEEILVSLEELLKSGYLSIYTIIHEKDLTEKKILNLTQSALLWLSMNKSSQNPFEMDYLQSIYDICLTEELWLRIFDNSSFHKKLLNALEEPQFIIDLHNEAVTHLIDIILDPESFMYTKFAPEFKKFIRKEYTMPCSYEYFDDTWQNEDYKAKLEEVMFSFKLPQWKHPWPIDNNVMLKRCITSYCQKVLLTSDCEEIFYDMISNLSVTSGISIVSNFIDVLLYIVKRKISSLDKDLKVIYNKSHIKRFRTLPWWLKSNLLAKYEIIQKRIIPGMGKENKKENDIDEPMVKKRKLNKTEVNNSEFEPLAKFCESSQSQVMEVHNISRKIEVCLKEHRQQSYSLEEKLKNALLSEIEYTQ
ncbi:RRM_XMAS2 and SAC3_GANP domain-containing protein xmas [Xylocopa sonorina]|uniref:RRM_XMAS2 and SAC3_GANP domain-containing protein xmas n=1 Tax=Xylocopa sonorina TaxID=1818115 RepID=UPI00403A9322